jgi:hypothetical protein
MFKRVAHAIAGLALVALMATPAAAQTGPTISYVTVAQGNASGVREPAKLVVRDQAAWLALWGRHRGSIKSPIPTVDFGRDMVVAIFGGESREVRRLTIRKIVGADTGVEVWYTLAVIRPLPDGDTAVPAIPFQMVRLARSPLPVRFFQIKTPQVY